MKFGYLRTDDSAHWYLIPESLVQEFDRDCTKLFEDTEPDSDEFYVLCEEFNTAYSQYRLSGSPYDLKVVMPHSGE